MSTGIEAVTAAGEEKCAAADKCAADTVTDTAASLLDLPVGNLLIVASYLRHDELARLAYTCRSLLPVALSEQAWKPVFERLNEKTPLPVDGTKSLGFRERCAAIKRAKEYRVALQMGRVGRIAGPKAEVTRYLATDELEAGKIYPTRTMTAEEEEAMAKELSSPFASLTMRVKAAAASEGGSSTGSAAGASAVVVLPAVALRQGTASWSALARA